MGHCKSLCKAPALVHCEEKFHKRRDRQPGVIYVSRASNQLLNLFLLHLHKAGIHHAVEVRKVNSVRSENSCVRDRLTHKFVEETLNAFRWSPTDIAPFSYRCIDTLDLCDLSDSDVEVKSLAEKIVSSGKEYLASVPETEDCVSLSDLLGAALTLPLLANSPSTSSARTDKHDMQQALQTFKGIGARQVCASSENEAHDAMQRVGLSFPVVVKPRTSSGSEGVFLCRNEFDVSRAVAKNRTEMDAFGHIAENLVVQEYFVGEEFVVNTVTVNSHHRVLDMWKVTKHVVNDRILYGHQILVNDSSSYPDVVEFCMHTLDAVCFCGGAAHLEVVKTKMGVRLIEINPRQAGHSPRATVQVGENQISVLAHAIASPQLFVEKAKASPHYKVQPGSGLVLVCFLTADKDAEVPRDSLLEIMRLCTFHRFDRINLSMFAERVTEAPEGSFWVTSRTRGLFTHPVVVILEGEEDELLADLDRIREIEKTMCRPYGSHDPSLLVGALTGGNMMDWHDSLLKRNGTTSPEMGDRMQVLPNCSLQEYNGDPYDYYKEHDVGTVTRCRHDRFEVTWDRTGVTICVGILKWEQVMKCVSKVPHVGCSLRPLPLQSAPHFDDIGTVTKVNGHLIFVEWDRSGETSSVSRLDWAKYFEFT